MAKQFDKWDDNISRKNSTKQTTKQGNWFKNELDTNII